MLDLNYKKLPELMPDLENSSLAIVLVVSPPGEDNRRSFAKVWKYVSSNLGFLRPKRHLPVECPWSHNCFINVELAYVYSLVR